MRHLDCFAATCVRVMNGKGMLCSYLVALTLIYTVHVFEKKEIKQG